MQSKLNPYLSFKDQPGASITMALNGDHEAELTGATFGSFTDRFGIEWVVNIGGTE